MPRYRITSRITKEVYEIDAPTAQDACERLGWMIGDCHVRKMMHEGRPPERLDPGERRAWGGART